MMMTVMMTMMMMTVMMMRHSQEWAQGLAQLPRRVSLKLFLASKPQNTQYYTVPAQEYTTQYIYQCTLHASKYTVTVCLITKYRKNAK